MKRPAFQFYPKEWLGDFELRLCSSGARGLWADLMCMMHEGQPYGHLTFPQELILRTVGMDGAEYGALLAELETIRDTGKSVAYRTDAGVIYSKRMVRDEEHRATLAANGRFGGRPPKVLTGGGTRNCFPAPVDQAVPAREAPARMTSREQDENLRQWEEFKALYPAHRLDEEPAARAWVSREEESAAILAGLRVWAVSLDWSKDNGEYVKWASGFISNGIYKTKPKVAGTDKSAGPAYRKWAPPKPTE